MKKLMLFHGLAIGLGIVFSGCQTAPQSPYDYVVANGDGDVIKDPYAKTERINRLKVAVRPSAKTKGERNVSKQVCAKVKDKLALSSYFEIAVRDDLSNIETENVLSGTEASESSVVPSDMLVLVDANIESYIGGVAPGRIYDLRKQIEAYERQGHGGSTACQIARDQLSKSQQKPVEDPKDAYGVAMRVVCSAYDSISKRQYVSYTLSDNQMGEIRGRLDQVIDNVSNAIADKFVRQLTDKVSPAMKSDCVVEETRGSGAVAKVDVSALLTKISKNAEVTFYTHTDVNGKVKRRDIAKGCVLEVEGESAWIKVDRNFGYGAVHIGHCAEFN